MNNFPSTLLPTNREHFSELTDEYVMKKLREEVYFHVLTKDENEYFILDNFVLKYNVQDRLERYSSNIIKELTTLGWKCKTSYGGTALFIYSTEDAPPSCYPDLN